MTVASMPLGDCETKEPDRKTRRPPLIQCSLFPAPRSLTPYPSVPSFRPRELDDVPDDVAYRHSKNPQPFHTDGSYLSNYPQIMLMYCVNQAPKGGETTFISADALLETLKEKDSQLLHKLSTQEICFSKATWDRNAKKVVHLRGWRLTQYCRRSEFFC